MIARISILIILGILLPDFYVERHYLSRRPGWRWWKRVLWWLPSFFFVVATAFFAQEPDFIPTDAKPLFLYLLTLGVVALPKAVFALCSLVGLGWCRLRHSRKNWGNLVGFFLALLSVYMVLYGSFVGPRHVEVRRQTITFEHLPKAFDGYRIVLFSDAHVGTFTQCMPEVMREAVDSINAQQADAIVFAGDLVNQEPSELYPVQDLLRSLKARDGVFSVLGNHDYSDYIDADPIIKAANDKEMVSRQRQYGWQLLQNSHQKVTRGADCIVFAGVEYERKKSEEQQPDIERTLADVDSGAFVIMVNHSPRTWRKRLLADERIALTLSGHTHGGQLELFGLRPSQWNHKEDFGLYTDGESRLFVTSGIGGVVPFRLGVAPEIVVITLRRGARK